MLYLVKQDIIDAQKLLAHVHRQDRPSAAGIGEISDTILFDSDQGK